MTKVLIIDDDDSIRNAYIALCQKQNWQVVSAVNGLEGIEKLKSEKPDVILLDVLMPQMGGMDFLQEVRKRGMELPATIMLTNSQVPHDTAEQAKMLGASSYSVKANTSVDQLLTMIRTYTGKP